MTKYETLIHEFYNNVLPNKPKYIRDGQALMNFMREFDPGEYDRISSVHYYDKTNIDCFYRDDLIPNTLKHLEELYKGYQV